MRRHLGLKALFCAAMLSIITPISRAQSSSFDFDTGNAPIEVVIPAVIPALVQTTTLNDAPLVLRHTTLITNAWFDAIAPYHPAAIGVYSRLGRRPASEGGNGPEQERCDLVCVVPHPEQPDATVCGKLAPDADIRRSRSGQWQRGCDERGSASEMWPDAPWRLRASGTA